MSEVPPRASWPEPVAETPDGAALTDLILTTFRLNALLMDAAQRLATEGGMTAAWWQVLGGVIDEPRSASEIGRRMGVSRQGVRRIADLLVEKGLAEYRSSPSHRGVKLLACTEAGYWAIRRISLAQHPWAATVGAGVGADDLSRAAGTMQRLAEVLEAGAVTD